MKIKIHKRNYKIIYEKIHIENHIGMIEPKEGKIYLSNEIDNTTLYSTIVHELTHAFMFEYALNDVKEYTEENICNILGAYGKDIIQKADKIFKSLKGG